MAEPSIIGVREGLVQVALGGAAAHKNEVAFVEVGDQRLQAEVLRIRGDVAELQVFEDTRGIRRGDRVELSGELLSAALGPGLLGQVYDGLQNPLAALWTRHGTFLQRGARVPPLDPGRRWAFEPAVANGAPVAAGQALGHVQENRIAHPVVVPFDLQGDWRLDWIDDDGSVSGDHPVAALSGPDGARRTVSLIQRWPVRRSLGADLVRSGRAERLYSGEPLLTGIRLIDSFFPVARGGTACIPGPFGAGKTVLLNLIARFAQADVVVMVACGERAGEVTELIETFPKLADPKSGGSLMDRTVIVCNTSAMPVSARESSIHLGATIGEYYRALGLDVLLLADSTSRWAQALRETSGFMEEIPGDEAFPAYLDSSIKALYERSGIARGACGEGALSMIGTVSPAGGNLEEPVTQATLGTVKAFLGLSSERAYRRAYPAIDPLVSWSRYRDQLAPWLVARLGAQWTERTGRMHDLLAEGERVAQLVAVTGEDGVTLSDYVQLLKSQLLDEAFLQQNAMDPVDASTPLPRQARLLALLDRVFAAPWRFADKEEARARFTALTSLLRNMNLTEEDSEAHGRLESELAAQLPAS